MVIVAKKRKTDQSQFGERLKALRTAAGLSLTELGERADMAYTAIGRLERSEREPTWPTVLKLASALGVSAAAFEADPDQTDDDPDPPARPSGKRK